MHLSCVHCGQAIPAVDMDLQTALARCRSCQAVFSFARLLRETDPGFRSPFEARVERGEVPIPPGIEVHDEGGGLRLVHRWFKPSLFFMALFCVAWDSFLVFWYASALSSDATPWLSVVFPVAHVGIGAWLTYSTLAGFVNRTTFEVQGGWLRVRHAPLPWPGRREIPAAELRQLYCERRESRSDDSTTVRYAVHAQLTDGRKLTLIQDLEDPDQALFVEQRIERQLGITDRAVAGAFTG